MNDGGTSVVAGFMIIFLIALGIIGFAIWLWALIDVLSSDFVKQSDKTVWIVVILFLPVLGSILYFIMGTKGKVKPVMHQPQQPNQNPNQNQNTSNTLIN